MFAKLKTGFSALTNTIAAAMLAAMFLTFLLQVGSRYMPRLLDGLGISGRFPVLDAIEPLGWTLELCLILWVWIVFFGCAFNVREKDHVTFDIFYLAAGARGRRIMALIAAASIVAGMVWAFLPTWDYVDFMRMRRTSTVENPITGDRIRLKWIFIIYMVFMAALILRYGWRFVVTWRDGPPDDHHLVDHDPKPPALRHGDDAV